MVSVTATAGILESGEVSVLTFTWKAIWGGEFLIKIPLHPGIPDECLFFQNEQISVIHESFIVLVFAIRQGSLLKVFSEYFHLKFFSNQNDCRINYFYLRFHIY